MNTPQPQRLLIIDDDQSVRVWLRRSLEREGYEVREAGEGGAALELLAAAPVDLVITDIVMPDQEGIALILALRKSHPQLPVIAISGGGRIGMNNYLEIAKGCGAARVLAKPFKIAQLLPFVRELIGPPPPAGLPSPSGKPLAEVADGNFNPQAL